MNRIEEKFQELKEKGEKAFISYIMCGDPSPEKTADLVLTIEKNGGDIVELGIPYSDPLADGPVIEAAGVRSLSKGFKLKDAFEIVRKVRRQSQIPLIFMCYYNTIFGYGRDKFIDECKKIGIDGLIVPDLPMEEREEIAPYLKGTGIALIPLAAVTSHDRIKAIADQAEGFVYCVSSLGVTGVRSNFHKGVNEFLKKTKEATNTPICVGFGIGKKEDVERFCPYVDGVIVGSALVKKFFESGYDLEATGALVRELKSGTK